MSLGNELKLEVLKGAENMAKGIVDRVFDPAVAEAVEKLKEVIPGDKYDFLAEVVAAQVAPVLKAQLLAQIEKISQEV